MEPDGPADGVHDATAPHAGFGEASTEAQHGESEGDAAGSGAQRTNCMMGTACVGCVDVSAVGGADGDICLALADGDGRAVALSRR